MKIKGSLKSIELKTIESFLIRNNKIILLSTIVFIVVLATITTRVPEKEKHTAIIIEDFIQQGSPDVVTVSVDTPEEKPPLPSYEWLGSNTDPKKISIPSLGVDNFIQKVGIDQYNEIAVPTNVHIAGWFVDSVPLGEKGLSVIAGHVDGRETGGIFKDLKNIQIGSELLITLGDGKELRYKVFDVSTVQTENAVSKLFSQQPKVNSQLNLITCGGNWDESSQSYDQRIIVYTELIG